MAPKSREHVHSEDESSGDEGTIKNLDYKPPNDFSLYKTKKHATPSVFDADEAAKHELWLIRVPEGVTNDDLATMTLNLPPKSHSKSSTSTSHDAPFTLGTLKKKEVSSNSSSSTTIKYQLQTVSGDSGFAGEMLSLNALIPDAAQGGRLVQAPLGVHHHLALVAQTTIPSGVPLAEEILSRPVPERDQPEGLKMRFKFSGSETQVPGAKLSGSGKEFAARWAKTLEKRRQEEEEALLRAQQEDEDSEDEAEQEETEEVVAESSSESTDATPVAAEPEAEQAQEAQINDAPAKKRKGDALEVDADEQKKTKKDKKEKKEKKEKK